MDSIKCQKGYATTRSSNIAGMNRKWYNQFGKVAVSLKIYIYCMCQHFPFLHICPMAMKIFVFIHDSPKLETMSINRRMVN